LQFNGVFRIRLPQEARVSGKIVLRKDGLLFFFHGFIRFRLFLTVGVFFLSNAAGNAVDLIFAVDQSGSMYGNDPEFLTPCATMDALEYINKHAPSSNVGYFGFENGICDGTGGHIGSKSK
jgi:hypothetical protein